MHRLQTLVGCDRFAMWVKGGMNDSNSIVIIQGCQKKREPKIFDEISPNFGPINLKMCMNNLNTHGF